MRKTAMEKLSNDFLIPILRFCNLYITEQGFIRNSDYDIPYKNQEGKTFIIISNYDFYLYYLNNKDNLIPFNPFLNKIHLAILMKWVQTAIFQLDEEFDEFFYDIVFDKHTNEKIHIEKNITNVESIFKEAEKRIKLLSFNPDYKRNIRKRWIIETNLYNEKIDKCISEVILPEDTNINISVIISILQICDYYDRHMSPIMPYNRGIEILNNICYLLERVNSEMKKNNKKFKIEVVDAGENARDFSSNENATRDKFGNIKLKTNIGKVLDF